MSYAGRERVSEGAGCPERGRSGAVASGKSAGPARPVNIAIGGGGGVREGEPPLRVVLASDTGGTPSGIWAAELIAALERQYPGRSVEIERRPMRSAYEGWDHRSVAVLFRSDHDDGGALTAQLGRARDEGLATVLLVPRERRAASAVAAARERRRRPAGVPVRRQNIDPRELAIMLATLAEREPARLAIERELSLTMLGSRQLERHVAEVHHELEHAAQTHAALVRRPAPTLPDISTCLVFRPAGFLSGDVALVEGLDERHVSFFVADAVGHGVPAAMLTLFVTKALPRVDGRGAGRRIVPPGEALARLNNEFVRGFRDGGRFATAFYGVLDRQTMTATVAGAGHPAMLVRRRDPAAGPGTGVFQRVDSGGPLLGVFPDAEFEEETVHIGEGESLVLYTDGLESAFPSEARPDAVPGDGDGGPGPACAASPVGGPNSAFVERLGRLADECAAGDETDAGQRFEALLDRQRGSLHQPDDITTLVLTRRRVAASAAGVIGEAA